MIEIHILPFFSKYAIEDITPTIVKKWQDEMKQKEKHGKRFTDTFLHSVQSQLNAILNYAKRKQYISFSPMVDLKNMGKKDAEAKPIWSPQDYARFSEAAKEKPQTHLLFELYFWLGLRRGEALALTLRDITHRDDGTTIIHITHSMDAKKRVGETKTTGSKRSIILPKTIADELWAYIDTQYDLQPDQPIFDVSVSQLHRDMVRACEIAGVQKIRIHDLRHSAASILISSQKYSTTDVARHLGHSSATTTLKTYAHMMPETQVDIALTIDKMHT